MAIKIKKLLGVGLGVLVLIALILIVLARRHEIPIVDVRPYFKQSTPVSLPAGQYPVFERAEAETGLIRVKPTWGLSWNDFDGDGLPDLFVADHMHYPSALFINRGGLGFTKNEQLGYQVSIDDHMTAWGDYDGNGTEDFFITSGFHRPKQLFNNDGEGNFEEMAEAAGLRHGPTGSGRAGIMADFNGDSWLDIVAFNTGTTDVLFTNRGDGTFADTTFESRMVNSLGKDGGAIGDLDGDGDLDLVTMTYNGILLYMNRGDGVFIERSAQSGLVYPPPSTRTGALGDYDNDGDLDLYFAQGVPNDLLLQNQGDGSFVDVTDMAKISTGGDGFRSAAFVDLDNDGWLDIYVVDGGTDGDGNNPNLLLLNRGDGTFADITRIANADAMGPGNATSAAFADSNFDGFLDVAIGHGMGVHQISGPVAFLKNTGRTALAADKCGNWLHVFPDKRRGSRNGTGASIKLTLPDGRTLYRQAATGQRPLAQDAPGVHIGLGCAAYVEQLTVTWPDGSVANLKKVPANDYVLVVAEETPYRGRFHPAYLLGNSPMFGDSKTPPSGGESAARAAPETADQTALDRRKNELLAYAMADKLARDNAVTDDELESYYESNRELFTVPELIWIERMLLGSFTPRKQPKLPWKLAEQIVENLQEQEITAFELAVKENVRAWTQTNRKVGRYWDIEGETRGFTESGWFTPAMIEDRFGAELGETILNSAAGAVVGPIERKEESSLFDRDSVPFILDVIKIAERRGSRVIELQAIREDLRRMLARSRLIEAIDQLSGGSGVAGAVASRSGGYFNSVPYDIEKLADAARRLGFADKPELLRAFELLEGELAAERRMAEALEASPVTDQDIAEHIRARKPQWEQGEMLRVRHLYFSQEADGEAAEQLLAQGKSLDQVIEELEIPNLNSRAGRGTASYFEEMLLDSRLVSISLGHQTYHRVNQLEIGEVSPLINAYGNFHLFLLQERINDEVRDDARFRRIAQREINLARELAIIDGNSNEPGG